MIAESGSSQSIRPEDKLYWQRKMMHGSHQVSFAFSLPAGCELERHFNYGVNVPTGQDLKQKLEAPGLKIDARDAFPPQDKKSDMVPNQPSGARGDPRPQDFGQQTLSEHLTIDLEFRL